MSIKHKRNAIINLLESELSRGGWTFDELGDKIEYILRLVPMTKRREKDEDAPKKPRTAYTFFCQKNRAETVEKMKKDSGTESVKSTEVARALGEGWRELKSRCENGNENALNEMQEYKTQYKEDKERYYGESAAFEKRLQHLPG